MVMVREELIWFQFEEKNIKRKVNFFHSPMNTLSSFSKSLDTIKFIAFFLSKNIYVHSEICSFFLILCYNEFYCFINMKSNRAKIKFNKHKLFYFFSSCQGRFQSKSFLVSKPDHLHKWRIDFPVKMLWERPKSITACSNFLFSLKGAML